MVLGGAGDGVRLGVLQTGLPRFVLISIKTHTFSISIKTKRTIRKLDKYSTLSKPSKLKENKDD